MESENTPSKKLSDLSDDELVQRLESKAPERDWTVGEYREIVKRGSSILNGYPGLERKYSNYENRLQTQIHKVQKSLSSSSNFQALARVENQFRAINRPFPTPTVVNQQIVDAIQQQAKNIESFVANPLFLNAVNVNKSVSEAVAKQANEISKIVSSAQHMASVKSSLLQIQLGAQLIDSATRSAGILAKIPSQLSMSQESFFARSSENPTSIVSESSDSDELNGMLSSNEYEESVIEQVLSEQTKLVEVVLEVVKVLNQIHEHTKRGADAQEKENDNSGKLTPSKVLFIVAAIAAVLSLFWGI